MRKGPGIERASIGNSFDPHNLSAMQQSFQVGRWINMATEDISHGLVQSPACVAMMACSRPTRRSLISTGRPQMCGFALENWFSYRSKTTREHGWIKKTRFQSARRLLYRGDPPKRACETAPQRASKWSMARVWIPLRNEPIPISGHPRSRPPQRLCASASNNPSRFSRLTPRFSTQYSQKLIRQIMDFHLTATPPAARRAQA
jgi:hypothetical protein